MGEKKSFVLFNDLSIPVKSLSDEEAGKLFKAIFEYQNSGVKQELSASAEMAFIFVKQQLDRSQKKYEETCKKNSENAHKRWDKNKANNAVGCGRMPTDAKHADSDPDPDPDPDSDNEPEKKIKDIKHKYGEYHHVLLTDKQYEGLKDKVDDREKWIRIIDENIEEKGNIYKIKNFYLAILKWYGRDNTIDKQEEERNKKFDERHKARMERQKARFII